MAERRGPDELRVAVIGHGFMGRIHSHAWRVAPRFFDLPAVPRMALLIGRDRESTERDARAWGWDEYALDWRAAVERKDIDVVDICAPGSTHADIAIAALEAGKSVLCEKPLANSVVEAERMADAALQAAGHGAFASVGFSYRRVPAVSFARELILDGRIGEVRQVRAHYLQDWLADEHAPLTWRLNKSVAGSGSLGDIGAHAIDTAQFLTSSTIDHVSGSLHTFVQRRPELGRAVGLSGTPSTQYGDVDVDDVALFTGRLSNGALGSFEATRFATGRKNAFRVEVSGSRGAIAFDIERLNELHLYDAMDPEPERGFRRILVTEESHPYMKEWWPTGHAIGYEHSFTHQVMDFVTDIRLGRQPTPSFGDGLQIQRVLSAVETSSTHGSVWTSTLPLASSSLSHARETLSAPPSLTTKEI